MGDALNRRAFGLDIEAAAGADRDAAVVNTAMNSLCHCGRDDIPGAEAEVGFLRREITTWESVRGEAGPCRMARHQWLS